MIDRRLLMGSALAAGLLPGVARAAGRIFTSDIAIEEGRVWMSAMVAGHGPYLFIVDTGGALSLLDDDLARSLKLKEIGQGRLHGVGGVSELPWYNAGDVLFGGGIRLPNMLFAGTHARLGKDAVGSFGAGLFTGIDSDLDFVKGEWRAYADGRPNYDGMVKLKSRFWDQGYASRLIMANATVAGYSGEFLLDTGAPRQISLEGRAAAKAGLWGDDRPYAPMFVRGIGAGRVVARLVRGERMTIGPFAFERPLVLLHKPGTSSGRGEGTIGLRALRLLNLSTQVSSGSVWASPNHLRDWAPDYPMSGLWIDEDKGSIAVVDVGTGSPAAAAGLEAGDAVLGAPFDLLLRRLGGPAGSRVPLTVERGGKRIDVTLTLADYL